MAWKECAGWLLGFCLVLPGCAFAEVKVRLDPRPTIVSGEGEQREVVVFPSHDGRTIGPGCGARRNQYGADVGRVRCLMEPTQWLNEAVLLGLDRRSFRIVTLANARSRVPLEVHLTLNTLFIDEEIGPPPPGLIADVEVRVLVTSKSGLRAERSFFARATQPGLTEATYEEAMLLATRELSNEVLDAIVGLANRYPALGRVEPQPSPVALRGGAP